MKASVRTALVYARSANGRRQLRFAATSGIAIVVSMATLWFCYGVLRWDGATSRNAQYVSFVVSTLVSYYLNRRWVWGRSGKSHFGREVLPFWGIGIGQLAISVPFVQWGRAEMEALVSTHALRTALFLGLNLFVYAVMWIGKYAFFNKVLFKQRPHLPAAEVL